ncbi:MAG: SDR family oxidoreductase [Bryobacteraceae bacterium]
MKRFVVTGGAGFIGSQLVRSLLREPHASIAVIDNCLSGKKENLSEVWDEIEFHDADIRDAEAMQRLLRGADAVFHLAAIPSVPRSISDPVPSHDVNINGTFEVLRACAGGGVGRVVYAASSSAYGDTPTLPKTESMQPNPKSPYAAQKLMGEYYASCFHSCFGLETVALRYFNVYGPRQDPSSPYSGVISIFMSCLLEGRSPTLFGGGDQTRDFTYVEDVASLCIKASKAEGVGGCMFNAGNGNRYSLKEVWQTLNEIEGTSIPANAGPPRAGDVQDSQADTKAAIARLGHQPQFTLEEGLRRTLAWYRSAHAVAA